jgi:N-terminal domain of galactosyltransferase
MCNPEQESGDGYLDLTLLIPYRNRMSALLSLLKWLQLHGFPAAWPGLRILLLEGAESASVEVQSLCQSYGLAYHFLDMGPVFHKTKLLNLGLSLTQTRYITAYDTDLLPLNPSTLRKHLQLAINSPALLITGYRLMLETESWSGAPTLTELATSGQIAPEDQPTALRKHLLEQERFGVLPLFATERLQELGGWDESFLGWGGEDQDMIERYLGQTMSLCRVPELVYLHLAHDYHPDWHNPALIEQNRHYYYRKRCGLSIE